MTVEHQIVHYIIDEDFHYEIGPDRDGLGLTELRYVEEGRITVERMTFSDEHIIHLATIFADLVNQKKLKP